MRNVSKKSRRENQNTHFMLRLFSENRSVYEIMSKNVVDPEGTQTIWRVRLAYSISKPIRAQAHARACAPTPIQQTHPHTHTHKYVILIAFHGNSSFVNAPQCYITRTFSLLSNRETVVYCAVRNTYLIQCMFSHLNGEYNKYFRYSFEEAAFSTATHCYCDTSHERQTAHDCFLAKWSNDSTSGYLRALRDYRLPC